MDLVWKGAVGGLVTALIAYLSKKGDTLPGILPLFPTFGIIALMVMGARGDLAGMKISCLASVKTIPAYFAFLAVSYLCFGRMDYRLAILAGLAAWSVVIAGMFLLLPRAA